MQSILNVELEHSVAAAADNPATDGFLFRGQGGRVHHRAYLPETRFFRKTLKEFLRIAVALAPIFAVAVQNGNWQRPLPTLRTSW